MARSSSLPARFRARRWVLPVAIAAVLLIPGIVLACGVVDLAIIKTGPATAKHGDIITYGIAADHVGTTGAITRVTVTDTLPAGVTFIAVDIVDASCAQTSSTPITVQCFSRQGVSLFRMLPSDPPRLLFNIRARVETTTPCGLITNVAEGTSLEVDSNSQNNKATVATNIQCSPPDYKITKRKEGSLTVPTGAIVTYVLDVTNVGTGLGTTPVVRDVVPPNLTFLGASGANCVLEGNTVVCTKMGAFQPNETKSLRLTFILSPTAQCMKIPNLASVQHELDQNQSNNQSDLVEIQTDCPTNVTVEKSGPTNAQRGGFITYAIKARNSGPGIALNVVVTDPVPQQLTYIGSTGASCSEQNAVVTCHLGTLQNSEARDIKHSFAISPVAPCQEDILNSVRIASGNDSNPNDNEAGPVRTKLDCPPPPPEKGCVLIDKRAFDVAGSPMSQVPQFSFKLDGTLVERNDSSGFARFSDVTPGQHLVEEIVPAGWNLIQQTPGDGIVHVQAGAKCAGIEFKNRQVISSSSSSSVVSSSSISSSSANSVPVSSSSSSLPPPPPPPPEKGCIIAMMLAFHPNGQLFDLTPQFTFTVDGSTVGYNDATGRVKFIDVPAGPHTVKELLPPGWTLHQMTPPDGIVHVFPGAQCGVVEFKNIQKRPVVTRQCNDDFDNDWDGKVDGQDPGCFGPDDDDEWNPPVSSASSSSEKKPQCSDGLDNDWDGKVDYPADPGCDHPWDNDEWNPPVSSSSSSSSVKPPQCSDGLDNDFDGKIDFPQDPGCQFPDDNDEWNQPVSSSSSSVMSYQCSDGIDNDNDGAVDYPADFSCAGPLDNFENFPKAQCQDGVDNDWDGYTDWPLDPGCESKQDNNEFNLLSSSSSSVAYSSSSSSTHSCSNNCSSASSVSSVSSSISSSSSSISYSSSSSSVSSCPNSSCCKTCCSGGCSSSSTMPRPQCSDGKDNDGDGKTDWPLDAGCKDLWDNDERDANQVPQCSDGKDNDNDGKTDFPFDLGCRTPWDNDEKDPNPWWYWWMMQNDDWMAGTEPTNVNSGGTWWWIPWEGQ